MGSSARLHRRYSSRESSSSSRQPDLEDCVEHFKEQDHESGRNPNTTHNNRNNFKFKILYIIFNYILYNHRNVRLFAILLLPQNRIENIIIRSTIKMSTIVLYNITMIDHYDHDIRYALSLSISIRDRIQT